MDEDAALFCIRTKDSLEATPCFHADFAFKFATLQDLLLKRIVMHNAQVDACEP